MGDEGIAESLFMAQGIIAELSDGERQIMKRKPYRPIKKSDWRVLSPTDAAFTKLHKKGLISFNRAAGDVFWMIDTQLGLAVNARLTISGRSE